MDPLKRTADGAITSRRRRTTAHPWADAYLRAHGIEDAALRAEIVRAIVARAESRAPDDGLEDANDHVMAEAQAYLDERLASFVGGFAPGQEAIAGRLAFLLVGGPTQCPSALLDSSTAPAALRFEMRTAQVSKTPLLMRASMVSRPIVAATQAIDFRAGGAEPGAASGAVHRLVRTQVPTMDSDRNVAVQLAAVDGLLTEIVGAAEAAVGALA